MTWLPPFTVICPPTVITALLVSVPFIVRALPIDRVPSLVTVLPLRLTKPWTTIEPSLVTVASGLSAIPGALTTIGRSPG